LERKNFKEGEVVWEMPTGLQACEFSANRINTPRSRLQSIQLHDDLR